MKWILIRIMCVRFINLVLIRKFCVCLNAKKAVFYSGLNPKSFQMFSSFFVVCLMQFFIHFDIIDKFWWENRFWSNSTKTVDFCQIRSNSSISVAFAKNPNFMIWLHHFFAHRFAFISGRKLYFFVFAFQWQNEKHSFL